MSDACELVTHEHHKKGDVLYNLNDENDKMYIVIDGRVDFSLDMEKEDIMLDTAEELGEDLRVKNLHFRL